MRNNLDEGVKEFVFSILDRLEDIVTNCLEEGMPPHVVKSFLHCGIERVFEVKLDFKAVANEAENGK